MKTLNIAVVGCCHGELDRMYDTIKKQSEFHGVSVDLVLVTGDFQAIRDSFDLSCMAVPEKYKSMGDFEKYLKNGAPYLTIFIGGNHEASNHLWESYHGGFVAKNIYYLGHSGIVNFGGIRIAGISGIFKGEDHEKPYYEDFPRDLRSAYHTRSYEIHKMSQVKEPIDIFMSHDWPQGIEHYGDLQFLLARKSHFESDIANGTLGNPACQFLLENLQPTYWLSSHLHVRFRALRQFPENGKETRFIALDKCSAHRQYVHWLQIQGDEEPKLEYDKEWISILKRFDSIFPLGEFIPEKEKGENEGDESECIDYSVINYGASSSSKEFCERFGLVNRFFASPAKVFEALSTS